MQVYKDAVTGKLTLKDQCTWQEEAEGELKTVFKNGKLLVDCTLSDVRARVKAQMENERM